jgi:cytohesin
MRALIDLRANPQAQCNELRTPLHWAAHEGHCDAIRVLIGCGADLNTAAGDSGAALHLAAFKGQCHALSLLLDARADVNSRQAVGPHSRDRQVQLLNSSAAQFSLSIRGCIFGQRLLL